MLEQTFVYCTHTVPSLSIIFYLLFPFGLFGKFQKIQLKPWKMTKMKYLKSPNKNKTPKIDITRKYIITLINSPNT